ncbi:cytochrome P450 [Streptomyces sp. MH60]|uniref:cytochrome P450 n=1 Tax=Streptomyces sp. MH60 TaxID=1940758 RepID=UPI000CEDE3AF|nr:cytochrome P450 [Streptomyces sp. MH60]PPS71771.1 putative cytochrome P450 YjiB [Streptomyces sp. MH60]
MTDFADRWGLGPDKYWLRGRLPDQKVAFDEAIGVWQVAGYPEVLEVLNDSESFSADSTRLFDVDEEQARLIKGDMAQMNGPEHIHMRRQVGRAFSPKRMEDLEGRITGLGDELLAPLAGRDRFDLLGDFIDDLSGILFSELLGTPPEQRYMFKAVDQTMDADVQMSTVGEGGEEYFDSLLGPLLPLRDFLGEIIDERAKEPRQDLLSLMLEFRYLDGSPMARDEIINFAVAVLGAGHLTSPILIGNTMLCLESFPAQAARVRADRSLVPSMFEEVMRYFTPATTSYRATEVDVEVGGVKIPKDQMVSIQLGAANRDPRQFPDADAFDAGRAPNQHVGYGRGAHYCIGAAMARVETRVVFNLLLDRFPTLRVDPDVPPVFFGSPEFTGVRSLAVRTA